MANPEGGIPYYLLGKKRKMAKIIQINEPDEDVLECDKCENQTFFIIMDENDDITHFECWFCKERIEFHTITLTEKDMK